MSKTDKDKPWWMRAEKYREVHHWKCIVGREPCSLPPFLYSGQAHYNRRFTACFWDAVDDYRRSWWGQGSAPQWFNDHVWHNPERVRVRDTARQIIQDYNANGATDMEIANFQHRHNASWLYW